MAAPAMEGPEWMQGERRDPVYQLFCDLLATMVGDHRLMTYRDVGFEEQRPELRAIGTERADVVLLGEKGSVRKFIEEIGRRYGASTKVLGGQPSLMETEFFAEMLRRALHGPIHLVALVDFDPAGWSIARAFARQLQRYGIETAQISFLVMPERFTEEELRYLAVPVPAPTDADQEAVRTWIRESGGVHGKGLGIFADCLRPIERADAAFRAVTGLVPLAERAR